MGYKAILFDLDGTLLDTIEDIGESMNQALAEAGYPTHSMEAYKYFVGDGVATLAQRAVPKALGQAELAAVLARMKEIYGQRWDLKTRPYPLVVETLAALSAKPIALAVLSNKPDDTTRQVVERYFPGRFRLVRGQMEGVAKKPDPAGALSIAGQLGIAPGEFLYLGDTDVDMRTALGAGMVPLGALWGFRGREELQKGGARMLLSKPTELLPLLEGQDIDLPG